MIKGTEAKESNHNNHSKKRQRSSDEIFRRWGNQTTLATLSPDSTQRWLRVCHEKMARNLWEKTVESYIEGLSIHTQEDLLDLEKLRNAYSNMIHPLVTLATNQGFKLWQVPDVA